jgi:hypothetical protein
MTDPKRPLLSAEDRKRLRRMAHKAAQNAQTPHNRAYCSAVVDVLTWLDSEEMSPMLREVTR